MPDYSEYIILKNKKLEFYNHYRGDYTFLCDMLWGEEEAKRIIKNQVKSATSKFNNPFSRIIINEDEKEVSFQLGIPENENGEGILMIKKYLELVKITWPGWKINYLHNSYTDVINLFHQHNYDLSGISYQTAPDFLELVWDAPSGSLISLETNQEISYEFINKNIAEIISRGDKLCSQALSNKVPEDRIPFGGIHINQDSKTIQIWYTIEPYRINKWANKYWKGWQIEFMFWGYENHYAKIGKYDELKRILKELEDKAITLLKEEIINTQEEPYFNKEKKLYTFIPRKMSKKMMSSEFDQLIVKLP